MVFNNKLQSLSPRRRAGSLRMGRNTCCCGGLFLTAGGIMVLYHATRSVWADQYSRLKQLEKGRARLWRKWKRDTGEPMEEAQENGSIARFPLWRTSDGSPRACTTVPTRNTLRRESMQRKIQSRANRRSDSAMGKTTAFGRNAGRPFLHLSKGGTSPLFWHAIEGRRSGLLSF